MIYIYSVFAGAGLGEIQSSNPVKCAICDGRFTVDHLVKLQLGPPISIEPFPLCPMHYMKCEEAILRLAENQESTVYCEYHSSWYWWQSWRTQLRHVNGNCTKIKWNFNRVYFGGPGPKTVSLPGACQPNDVGIITAISSGASWATPSGWTAVTLNYSQGGLYQSVWYRVIQAGDTSWSFGNSSMNNASLVFVAFTGVYSIGTIDVIGTPSFSAGITTVFVNSITIATTGAFFLNAVAGIYPGTNPQFSAAGFSEYDNGPISVNYQTGLLWKGPLSAGVTSTFNITSSYGGGNLPYQYLFNIPFALTPLIPVVVSVPAVSIIGKTDTGFSDRQLENKSIRVLENNSVRLLEGSVALPAVAVIAKPPAVLATGYAAPTIRTAVISTQAQFATGYSASIAASTTFNVIALAVSSIGFVGLAKTAIAISASPVPAFGFTSSTVERTIAITPAMFAVGYAAPVVTQDIISISSILATGYVAPVSIFGVYSIQVAGSCDIRIYWIYRCNKH